MKHAILSAIVILCSSVTLAPVVTVPGDLDHDGDVDLHDFAIMQDNFSGPIPLWVQDLIDYYESRPAGYRPAFIGRYWYMEQFVFYRPSHCCDIPGVVYDAAGGGICSPGGGWSGEGDCPEFIDDRTDEWIVWTDG